ncbi:MAG: ABC transporter substrate-binding protein [Candidatus Lustribacter sp.]|jgi:NitT/TauT family transport system substrate-binding protein
MNRSSFIASLSALSAGGLPRSGLAQTPVLNLRIGANANDTYAAPYYAQDEGFFARSGLNVDLQTMANGAAIAAAVVSGAVDVGVAVPVTLASAHLHDLPFVIVAAGAMSLPTVPALRLCTAKTSTLKTPKDFEGHVIAINALGVGADFQLHAWLAQNGADFSKVKLAEVPFSEMGSALDHGTVDAALLVEPAFTVALRQYNIHVVTALDAIVGAPYLVSCWFTTRDFADKHPDHINRFIRVIYETQHWANGHKSETAAILSKYSKLDIAIALAMTRCTWADQLRATDIQVYLDMAAKYGGLARPVPAADLIYKPA